MLWTPWWAVRSSQECACGACLGPKKRFFWAFWRLFGTFWVITSPINAQWVSNCQGSWLVCSPCHFDALNTLVGCQELTGVCLRRVPGTKKRFFWVFWRLFGTFWVITSPINVQWASNCQGSWLVCSQCHCDALNSLVGCQELTGVCLRRVPGAKITLFWVFWGHNSINKCLIGFKLSGT